MLFNNKSLNLSLCDLFHSSCTIKTDFAPVQINFLFYLLKFNLWLDSDLDLMDINKRECTETSNLTFMETFNVSAYE